MAIVALVGFELGEGEATKARFLVKVAAIQICTLSALVAVLLHFLQEKVAWAYTDNALIHAHFYQLYPFLILNRSPRPALLHLPGLLQGARLVKRPLQNYPAGISLSLQIILFLFLSDGRAGAVQGIGFRGFRRYSLDMVEFLLQALLAPNL